MRVTINHFGYRTIRVPGHFEDYTTQETHYYYDKDGNATIGLKMLYASAGYRKAFIRMHS